jgi:hypothetical protein
MPIRADRIVGRPGSKCFAALPRNAGLVMKTLILYFTLVNCAYHTNTPHSCDVFGPGGKLQRFETVSECVGAAYAIVQDHAMMTMRYLDEVPFQIRPVEFKFGCLPEDAPVPDCKLLGGDVVGYEGSNHAWCASDKK